MKTAAAILLLALLAPQASHARKRPQIERNLENVAQQLAITLEQMQAQRTKDVMAQFSADNAKGPDSGPYVFDQVLHNDSNAYNPMTEILTAPYTGTYLFMAQLFTDGSVTEHPFVDIEVNNTTVARLAFENGQGEDMTDTAQEDNDSTTITVKLQQANQVWVESEEGMRNHYWSGFHTFFSGTLLHSDNA